MPLEMEWDETKRASNIRKHGPDFPDAAFVFSGPHLRRLTPTVGMEERWLGIGTLGGRHVTIIFTHRGGATRIISMRRARRDETRDHHAAFGG